MVAHLFLFKYIENF